MRVFKKKHQVIYLGDKVERSSIVLSNHVGASGPLSWELYPEFPFRFWGTFEMNSDFKTMYHYLSKIYFHQKKHWPLWISRIFCLIATPVMKGMYKAGNISKINIVIDTHLDTLQDLLVGIQTDNETLFDTNNW